MSSVLRSVPEPQHPHFLLRVIRYIQQLLGHATLETTSIYTEVTVRQLQKIHALTHPTEKPDAPVLDDPAKTS